MSELERQLTAALETSSVQCEREQRRQSEQIEALRLRVEQQTAQSATLQRQVERLDEQMTRLAEYCGKLAALSRGRSI